MAVAKVAGIDGGSATVVTNADGSTRGSITQSLTLPGGHSDTVLVVEAFQEEGGSSSPPSSIVWNGSEALAIASDGTRTAASEDSSWSACSIWYVKNPTTGTHNVVMTVSPNQHCGLAVYMLENVDQTTPVRDVRVGTAGSGTSNNLTHSGMASGDMAVDVCAVDSTGHTFTPGGTGHGTDWGKLNQGGDEAIGGSNTDTGGAMNYSWTGSASNSHASVAFRVVSGAAAASLNMDLFDRRTPRRRSMQRI